MSDLAPPPAPRLGRSLRTTLVLTVMLGTAALLGYPGVTMGLAALAMLAALLGVLIALVTAGWFRLRVRALQALACLAVAAFSLGIARWYSDVAEPRRDQVVSAIDAYRAARGVYPGSLDALVPDYLDAVPLAVPTPLAGRRFRYRLLDGAFILHYSPAFGAIYIYRPDTGGWRMRD